MANENEEQLKNKRKKKNIAILVLMFLLLVTLFMVQCHLDQIKQDALAKEQETALEMQRRHTLDSLRAIEKARADSIRMADSLAKLNADNLADSLRIADSLRVADSIAALKNNVNRDSIRHVRDSLNRIKDSLAAIDKARADSLQRIADSLALIEKAKADSLEKKRIQDSIRAADQVPPVAEIAPPAGRYYDPIKLKVKCEEIKCKTFLSIGDTLHAQEAGKAIEYNKTGSVFFYAEDSVGNRTAWEEAKYDMASDNICGKNAYPVPLGGKTVCVDAYEYPNKADELPRDMVSQEQAASLCQQEGKHLCSLAEWQAACKSKDNTRYSYGDSYKQNKCNTNTKAAKRSGRKEQCRSWYGMYDMNGNLYIHHEQGAPEHVPGRRWSLEHQQRKQVHRQQVQLLPAEPVSERRIPLL